MQNSEITDIEASVTALVRRAFEAGRNDVLKRVVDSLKTDQPPTNLKLAGPNHDQVKRELAAPDPVVLGDAGEPAGEEPGAAPALEKRPWWSRPVR